MTTQINEKSPIEVLREAIRWSKERDEAWWFRAGDQTKYVALPLEVAERILRSLEAQ